MGKKVELEKPEFPKEFVHEDSEVVLVALNEIQAAAYKGEGFKEVKE